MAQKYAGHVLTFCTGVDEINELVATFRHKLNPRVFKVFPLHGRLTPEEQREVFSHCKEHKFIFATRIAETSITIDGVRVVIDPGEDREMVFDQRTKISSLQLRAISQSSAKQRAGRAGRTNEGFCFRLYNKKAKEKMKKGKTPEIQNMALDTLVLRLKSLEIEDVMGFPYLSKPEEEGLRQSVRLMKHLNCLNNNGRITEIGRMLVRIPIEPFLSRAIVEAMLFEHSLREKQALEKLRMSDG